MNIVNKLTLRHLKENKGRTVVTTLGICVSVAMITAVFVAVASFINLFGEIELLGGGNKHAVFEVNQNQLMQLYDDERIDKVGIRTQTENSSFRLEDRTSDRTGTGDIYQGDSVNLEMMFTGEYEGTVPQNESEIAVEQSIIEKNNLNWKVGDTVTIPLGYRYYFDAESGEESVLGGGTYFGDEQFKQTEAAEFKITAILHNNPATTVMWKIVRGFDSKKLNLENGEVVSAYIQLKEVNYKSLDVVKDIIKDYDIKDYEINDDYLETKFAIDDNSVLMTNIIPMAMIILAIIMIASVVLIYNAFGMSLSERVRYLGMLASVGATKIQKKASVYYEGFILGAIGIPVGILAGIAGIGITLKVVGKQIISTGTILGTSDSDMNMEVVVPLWAIIGIILFSVLTIFISSFIPSRKASGVTPVDAIRQREEIKVKYKKLKSPKIVRAIFGYEGELAHKNLKRNGRKSRVITASIALSVILFLSCNYFCSAFTRSIDLEVDVPYQIQVLVPYESSESFFRELDNVSDIDNYYCINNSYLQLSKAAGESGGYDQSIANKDFLTNTYKNLFDSTSHMYINYIEDEKFNQLCKDNGIDSKEYYGDTAKALIMNNISHQNGGDEVFNNKVLGTNISTGDNDEVEVNDFIKYDQNNYICGLNPKNTISLYVPLSQYYNIICKDIDTSDLSYMVGVETEQHEKVTEAIENILDEQDYGSTYISDFVESFQTMNTLVFVLEVFVYGFIVLITFITVANIINTISTGIAMRRKEFAMLKSVGTTPKGFRKMVSLESVFYGVKALIFSIPISILISYGMNKTLSSNVIPFEMNWLLYLAVIAVVFVIVGLTMLYAVSKVKDDSIVETLKKEIT